MKKDFLCQVILKIGTARTPYISGRSINWYNFGKQLDSCTKTLLVALFTMAKHWKPSTCARDPAVAASRDGARGW